MPKKSDAAQEISVWINALNIRDYKEMVINSKCMFNRLKEKQFD